MVLKHIEVLLRPTRIDLELQCIFNDNCKDFDKIFRSLLVQIIQEVYGNKKK